MNVTVRPERGSLIDPRLLFESIMKGDTSLLLDLIRSFPDNSNQSTPPRKNNSIIHLAIEKGELSFIKQTLKRFPALIHEKNESGETLLHIAAFGGNPNTVTILISHLQENTADPWSVSGVGANEDDERGIMARNRQGDTPFHVAIRRDNIEAAIAFCQECSHQQLQRLFTIANHEFRTPLHLLALHCGANDLCDECEDDIATLYKNIFICADTLRVAQDIEGNTPIHLAVKSGNYFAAKLLMQRCLDSEQRQELSIKNNEGHSIFDLLASWTDMRYDLNMKNNRGDSVINLHTLQSPMLEHAKIKELKEMMVQGKRLEKERASLEKMMADDLYQAAVKMDCNVFHTFRRRDGNVEGVPINNNPDAYFLAQTLDGSNIIHIALRQGKEEGVRFIEVALHHYPSLVVQADAGGDTPLHLAAKLANPVSEKLVTHFVDVYGKVEEQHKRGVLSRPWETKNSKGNMPVHEALRSNNFSAAMVLTYVDSQAASYINDFGETPLHVHARFGVAPVDDEDVVFDALITKNSSAVYVRDRDGLTPLLRAAMCGRIRIVRAILEHNPQSAYMRDLKGRTFLHLLRFTGGDVDEHLPEQLFMLLGKEILKIPEVDAQRLVRDFDDNTPLHYAMKTGNSITAEILTSRCLQNGKPYELMWANNQDQNIIDIIASQELPIQIVELVRKKHPSLLYFARSSYGVGEAHIKDSTAALSVIAALLATITFTAAFQVPGGFNGSEHSPVLLKKAAFQVFLVSDSLAMCTSTIVLFSLLWAMAAGKKFDSFILLDMSYFLLQASFYATLVAFMTGVYVVAYTKTLYLAILVCALCSLVILITWKRSIIFLTKRTRLVIDMLIRAKALTFRTYIEHHRSLIVPA